MKEKVTIQEIADMARVSISTVHRALYHKPGVSEPLRQEIMRLAQELGYCPAGYSMALRKNPLRIIVAFPQPEEDNRFFFSELWNGYREYRQDLKAYAIEFIEIPYEDTGSRSFVEQMKRVFQQYQGKIDGLLAGGRIFRQGYEVIHRLIENQIPVVLVGEDSPDCGNLCCVQADSMTEGRLAAEVLTQQISKTGKIVLCSGDDRLPSNWKNVAGFEEYLMENQCVNEVIDLPGYEESGSIKERVRHLLCSDQQVQGLYSVNLRNSLLMARVVHSLGMAGQVKLIGSDLCPESAGFMQRRVMTGIIFKNPQQQGRLGTKRLIDYLLFQQKPPHTNELLRSAMLFRSNIGQYLQEI